VQFPCTGQKESRIIACPGDLAMLGLIMVATDVKDPDQSPWRYREDRAIFLRGRIFKDAVVVCMASFSRKAE
jgi:hypothetical protein